MNRLVTYAVLAAAATLFQGCASSSLGPDKPDVLSETAGIAQYPTDDFDADRAAYAEAKKAGNEIQARAIRDAIIRRIAASLTEAYGRYEARFFGGRAAVDTGFDLVDLGLDAAITIVNGERVKTVLGAIATAVHGAGHSIDKNFFREKSTEALLAKMRELRAKKALEIEGKLKLDTGAYPLEEGWGDMVELYYAGTVPSALIALSEQAGKSSIEAQEDLRVFVMGRFDSKDVLRPVTVDIRQRKEGLTARFDALDPPKRRAVVNRLRDPANPLPESAAEREVDAAFRREMLRSNDAAALDRIDDALKENE